MTLSRLALDKFLRYVKIDTQSDDESTSHPSTAKQFDLARLLVDELKALGLSDAHVDEHCYVMATIPATTKKTNVPTIGFIAHVDTSPEVSGANVKPQTIERYTGGDITIGNGVVLRESECPLLKKCVGHTLITSDGTTLLGADNKAGIAAIMAAAETIIKTPFDHGTIKIAFTPDEEVGHGADYFDVKKFGADFAYTVDGGIPGELNKETFSANSAIITVKGRDIHPGTAKNIMVNSIRVMADIIALLPKDYSPECTERYEPFIHPYSLKGGVGESTLTLLLRDFETGGLDFQADIIRNVITKVQTYHPKSHITVEIKESYRNMRQILEQNPKVLALLEEAAKQSGVNPEWEPIRGGTDGSRLSAMGLPTPNIYTGGMNFHGKTELLSVQGLNQATETVINIARLAAQ